MDGGRDEARAIGEDVTALVDGVGHPAPMLSAGNEVGNRELKRIELTVIAEAGGGGGGSRIRCGRARLLTHNVVSDVVPAINMGLEIARPEDLGGEPKLLHVEQNLALRRRRKW